MTIKEYQDSLKDKEQLEFLREYKEKKKRKQEKRKELINKVKKFFKGDK